MKRPKISRRAETRNRREPPSAAPASHPTAGSRPSGNAMVRLHHERVNPTVQGGTRGLPRHRMTLPYQQWHSFSEFCHSVKDSVLGLGYPLVFYSVNGLPLPVLPFLGATFRSVFGIAAHRTVPDGAVADTGRSRRQYEPRFPGGRMPVEVAGSRCWPPPPQVRA